MRIIMIITAIPDSMHVITIIAVMTDGMRVIEKIMVRTTTMRAMSLKLRMASEASEMIGGST